MVSKMDDYLIHQTEKPLVEPASDHPEWQDRFYFNIHDRSGDFAAIVGLGAYPNKEMMQAYFHVIHEGQHYSYSATRPLHNDREVMQAGSLSFSIVEPLEVWHLELVDEANDIHASLDFRARCSPHLFDPIHYEKDGTLVARQMHLTQSGLYSGTFTVGDKAFTDLWGMRDRSWGIRVVMELPFFTWLSAQFPTFCISVWQWETPDGDIVYLGGAVTREGGAVTPITSFEQEIELWPGSKRPRRGHMTITTAAGDTLSFDAREISSVFLGYPSTRWSEADAAVLAEAEARAIHFDQFCEFTMGEERGYGLIGYHLHAGSSRYGIPATPLRL